MFRHGATCPANLVSKARIWWIAPAVDDVTAADMALTAFPSATVLPEEDIRHDLVARVRREIAEGIYDTPDKWEAACQKLLDVL
jgi:hypothetical protein